MAATGAKFSDAIISSVSCWRRTSRAMYSATSGSAISSGAFKPGQGAAACAMSPWTAAAVATSVVMAVSLDQRGSGTPVDGRSPACLQVSTVVGHRPDTGIRPLLDGPCRAGAVVSDGAPGGTGTRWRSSRAAEVLEY